MDQHHEPATGSVVSDAWDHHWQRQDTGRWLCSDHDQPPLTWAQLWEQHGPLQARAVQYETGPAPEALHTAPMLVAVTWEHEGRQQLGRVADWVNTGQGWTAFVITERGHRGGGWLPADRLQPSDHPVATTFGAWEWGSWQPPTWPEPLARFAGAAWNDAEHDRAAQARPDR
jgi:hypothetical protein